MNVKCSDMNLEILHFWMVLSLSGKTEYKMFSLLLEGDMISSIELQKESYNE